MWEDFKTSNHRLLIVVAIVLLCAGIGGWRYYESSRAKADYHDVNSGLERIEDRMGRAETGLNATQAEIYNAESEVLQIKLERTEKSLMNATTSLTEVKKELQESRLLLEELKNKIKKMEHNQAVIRKQRDIYAGLFVITVGAAIARR